MKGRSAGVTKAPVSTLIRQSRRKGQPSNHALLKMMPDGSSPKIIRMTSAASGNRLSAWFSSMGVSTRRCVQAEPVSSSSPAWPCIPP